METIKFEIPNISCGHCVDKVQNALENTEGVVGAWADAMTKSVEIEFGPPADQAGLKQLLADINYPVHE